MYEVLRILHLLRSNWYARSPYHECKARNTDGHETFEGVSRKYPSSSWYAWAYACALTLMSAIAPSCKVRCKGWGATGEGAAME